MEPYSLLIERKPGIINLAVRSAPGDKSYAFGSAVSLDAAYGGTTAMFEVPANGSFSSKTLAKSRVNAVYENNRGLTRVQYNPVDYASASIPGDTQITFVRVKARDAGGTLLAEGPILVVPPGDFFWANRRSLVLNGTAPNVAAGTNNLPPQNAMRFVLPQFADHVRVLNTGANTLYVSFDQGLQEAAVAPVVGGVVQSVDFWQAGSVELFVRGNTTFTVIAAITNGSHH